MHWRKFFFEPFLFGQSKKNLSINQLIKVLFGFPENFLLWPNTK